MTVSVTTKKTPYTGTGANTALSTVFLFFEATEIVVTKRITATGVESTLVKDTHFSVTGGSGAAGTVTPIDGATDFPSTVTWTLSRNVPLTQSTDYTAGGDFPEDSHEDGLDKLVLMVQDMEEVTDRALKFPVSDLDSLDPEIPDSVTRASQYLTFDSSGNPTVTAAQAPATATISAAAQTVLDDATIALMRATLGVPENAGTVDKLATGTNAAKDTAVNFGEGFYYETDTETLWYSNATAWQPLVLAQHANASLPAAATAGRIYLDTDTLQLKRDSGAALVDLRPRFSRGHIQGLKFTYPTATTLTIGVGECRGGTAADQDLVNGINTGAFTKDFSAVFAEDSGNGGRPAADAIAADKVHRVFELIKNDGTIDFGWDDSATAANLLAEAQVIDALWVNYRQIGWVITDASTGANIIAMIDYGGGKLLYKDLGAQAWDIDNAGTQDYKTAAPVLTTVLAPPLTEAILRSFSYNCVDGVAIYDPALTAQEPDGTDSGSRVVANTGGIVSFTIGVANEFVVQTDSSSRVALDSGDESSMNLGLQTAGWIDRRGQDD